MFLHSWLNLRPERVLLHSWENWHSGGQRRYSLTATALDWSPERDLTAERLGQQRPERHSFTAERTGVMEAKEGTPSWLSELQHWSPERVLLNSWENWGSGGQRGYSFIAEWTKGHRMYSSHGRVSSSRRGQKGHSLIAEWTKGQRGYSVTAEWTQAMEAREDTILLRRWEN